MKKNLIFIALLFVLVGTSFAAGAQDTTSVEGKLEIKDSIPFIKSDGKTYVFPTGAFYQLAFNNSIKAGDKIKAEGIVKSSQFANKGMRSHPLRTADFEDALVFMPSKIWVNGKSIDLGTIDFGQRQMGRQQTGRQGVRNSQRLNNTRPGKAFNKKR